MDLRAFTGENMKPKSSRIVQREARLSGKSYTTQKGKKIKPSKKIPTSEVNNSLCFVFKISNNNKNIWMYVEVFFF